MKKEILIVLVIIGAFALLQTLNFVRLPESMSSPYLVPTDDINFVQHITSAGDWTLVEFWRPGCPACVKLKPGINQIAEDYKQNLRVLTVNTNEVQGISGQFQVSATPTLILLYRGREVSRKIGYIPTAVLDDWVSTAINLDSDISS